MKPVKIRRAAPADAKEVADLVLRLKRLNGEFDPLFEVVPDGKQRAERYVRDSIGAHSTLLMVAASGDKILGALRAEVRKRVFYAPSTEGYITEMYVLPEHRRQELGQRLLDSATKELVKMGAEIMVADLPSRNEIGMHFYSKRGFRRLVETFAWIPQ